MTTPRFRLAAVPLALALGAGALLIGCGSDSDDANTPTDTVDNTVSAVGEVSISDQWARTSPKMTSAGAAYLQITNGTDADDTLTGASVEASVAATAEVHETAMADAGDDMGEGSGMMTMQEVDEITIPAGATVALEPGGYHIMLMDLAEPLATGDTFEITLTFAEAGDMVVGVEVRDDAP